MSLTDLIPTLQLATGPVILISGIGLILLSMTNRYGRLLDRARRLTGDLHDATDEDHIRLIAQLASSRPAPGLSAPASPLQPSASCWPPS